MTSSILGALLRPSPLALDRHRHRPNALHCERYSRTLPDRAHAGSRKEAIAAEKRLRPGATHLKWRNNTNSNIGERWNISRSDRSLFSQRGPATPVNTAASAPDIVLSQVQHRRLPADVDGFAARCTDGK